jgi:hypothetical protein
MPHICDILFIVTLYITENFENSDFHEYNVLYRILHTLKFPVIFQTFFIPLFVTVQSFDNRSTKSIKFLSLWCFVC